MFFTPKTAVHKKGVSSLACTPFFVTVCYRLFAKPMQTLNAA